MRMYCVEIGEGDNEYNLSNIEYIDVLAEDFDDLISKLEVKKNNNEIKNYSKITICETEGEHPYKFNMHEEVIIANDSIFKNNKELVGKKGIIFHRMYAPVDDVFWYIIYMHKAQIRETIIECDLMPSDCVYFIQDTENQRIKIGYSTNVMSRLKTLQVGCPNKLKLIGVMKGDRKQEKLLHDKFKEYNLLGEWFAPSKEILNYIQENII